MNVTVELSLHPSNGCEHEASPLESGECRLEIVGIGGLASILGDVDLRLFDLDTTEILREAVQELRYEACGTGWQDPLPVARLDCDSSIAPEGSAEYAVLRILMMTPANAIVEGTSLQFLSTLADIADFFEITSFAQVLADAMGISTTEPIVSDAGLVSALRDGLVRSHPATHEYDGTVFISVTLEDLTTDFVSLAQRLGPIDGGTDAHPGLVPNDATISVHFQDTELRIAMQMTSNVRRYEAVDASRGTSFVWRTLRAGALQPVSLRLHEPDGLEIEGLAEHPTVDLPLELHELPYRVDPCTGATQCTKNTPENPVTASSIWAQPAWSFEYNLSLAAYRDYADRVYSDDDHPSTNLPVVDIDIGRHGYPPGWLEITGIAPAPKPQYLWEALMDIGQVVGHESIDGHFAEGALDVTFSLRELGMGLTGDELEDAIRIHLFEQQAVIEQAIGENVIGELSAVPFDFYYRLAEDGHPYLFFVAPHDHPGADEFEIRGFFEDSALEHKVSRLEFIGVSDTVHEKLWLGPESTPVYFQDDDENVYRALPRLSGDRLHVDLEWVR